MRRECRSAAPAPTGLLLRSSDAVVMTQLGATVAAIDDSDLPSLTTTPDPRGRKRSSKRGSSSRSKRRSAASTSVKHVAAAGADAARRMHKQDQQTALYMDAQQQRADA